ncbi:hypothetical protein FA95DRAFT_1599881 [Auriscalpium vulgare]|uniref:Uncharacterized protein n=1 Tax=Auriscalpium vulgare TaxID=40419 RepID=A0ACB8R5X0_9AGAM|nr:hypothetical protein FA95DRAFT_1599881 [Auriscalpium vulgare]
MRGFVHPEFGRLLCPVTLNWDDPVVRAGIRDHDPKYPTGPKHWAAFLWANERLDPDNEMAGFLRGHLLTKAARAILLGPSAADNDGDADGAGEPSSRSVGSSKPRAAKWRIVHITPAAIAHMATLVHFALSSQATMAAGGDGGKWPYEQFYHHIVTFIERHMEDSDREELLAWWDVQVLSGIHNDEDSADEDENTDPAELSIMARMRLKSKTRAAEGAEPADEAAAVSGSA